VIQKKMPGKVLGLKGLGTQDTREKTPGTTDVPMKGALASFKGSPTAVRAEQESSLCQASDQRHRKESLLGIRTSRTFLDKMKRNPSRPKELQQGKHLRAVMADEVAVGAAPDGL
jgi:hypothetical protein